MLDNDTSLSGSLNLSSSFSENPRDFKRMRAGSISGRLRTASDLEEWGWIDKTQKGIVKDLIISGNHALQLALDKFERGDTSELEAMIRQGLFTRRHSIDLLDGLDLDFLDVGSDNQENGVAAAGDFGDFLFEQQFEEGDIEIFKSSLEGIGDGGGLSDKHYDRDWFMRRMSLGGSDMLRDPVGPNMFGHRDSSVSGDWGAEELFSADGFMPGGSDFLHSGGPGEVDLSAYESLAAQLQHGGGAAAGPPQVLKFSKRSLQKGAPGAANGGGFRGRAGEGAASSSAAASRGVSGNLSLRLGGATGRIPGPEEASRGNQLGGPSQSAGAGAGVGVGGIRRGDSMPPASMGGISVMKAEGSMGFQPGAVSATISTGSSPPQFSGPVFSSGATFSEDGFLQRSPAGYIGAYSPEARKERVDRFIEKRNRRVWTKKVKYDVRKNFADSRLRVKGRFVKKEDEELMRELLSI